MESSSSSSFQSLDSSEYVISNLDHFNLFILRPFLATTFVLSFILLGWLLAWKLVLVHVPLVQEIFGLRNKSRKPKPQTGRLSRFYSNINARDRASGWVLNCYGGDLFDEMSNWILLAWLIHCASCSIYALGTWSVYFVLGQFKFADVHSCI
ncbi:hypothetical protein CK203_012633 [Vitis vinifera]|uniref:Uncharacterized protein n=1 Tax=Vitis vinifera TaxID=29760 RepID=A0A438KMN2_VITVI|nr:hypothetical protein CK203_012633 [Vitis vinifera]